MALMAALSCAACASCGVVSINKPYEATEVVTQPEEPDTEAIPEFEVYKSNYDSEVDNFLKRIAGANYKGATVKIVSAKNSLVIPDENSGKIINDDLVERNAAVESFLNVSLLCEQKDAATMLEEIRAAVRAGDYYADAIMIPQSYIGTYFSQGALMNMRGLPGFESDVGFYYESAVDAGSGGDAVYGVAGAASLNSDGLCGVYFNKDIIEKCSLEDPYTLADKGLWTIDKYTEYVNAAKALGDNYFGYTSQNASTYLTDLLYFASGNTLTVSKIGSYPTLNMGGDNVKTSVDKIRAATAQGFSSSALDAIEAFQSGNTLFLIDTLDTMKTLANSSVNWGLLPLPKADAKQADYLSLAYYENAMFFCAVPTITNYELCSDLIACINIMSYGYTPEAYVNNASVYYLRDNQSIRMLAKIVENPVFDFAYSFSSNNASIPSATFMALRKAVSGVSSLENYVSSNSYGFNQSMYYLFDTDN